MKNSPQKLVRRTRGRDTNDPSIPAVTLHSIILLSALEISKDFQNDTLKLSNLLPAIFNSSLYYADPYNTVGKQDFLTKILNDQISVGYNTANGLLNQFASDVAKIPNGIAITNNILNNALIASVIEDYYSMNNGFTKAFFTKAGNGVNFNLNDLTGTDLAAASVNLQMVTALQSVLGQNSASLVTDIRNYEWYIDGENGSISASASDALPALMIASNGNDVLKGGSGDDVFVAGVGSDTFYGGAGTDTYILNTGNGRDTIKDSDGLGKIFENGTQLQGTTNKLTSSSAGVMQWDEGSTKYQFKPHLLCSAPGLGTMTITTGSDTITVENFDLNKALTDTTNGYLGIKLPNQVIISADTGTTLPDATDKTANVAHGNSQTFTIYALAGNTVKLNCTGSGTYKYCIGADLLAFIGGTATLTIPVGQDSITVTLIDTSDANTADTATLTVTTTDAGGNTITSNNLAVTFANPNPFYDADAYLIGNGFPTGYFINPGDAYTYWDKNNNCVTIGGYSYAAGQNGDWVITGDNDNQVYVNVPTDFTLATALEQQKTATADGLKNFHIHAGDGNNTIVGGNGNDNITTGSGNNVIVCGPGQVTVQGGVKIMLVNGLETLKSEQFNAPGSYYGSTLAGVPVGVGNSTIYGGTGDSRYYLSNGDNWLKAGGGNVTLLSDTVLLERIKCEAANDLEWRKTA